MEHKMKLNEQPFNSIRKGTKTIEMRLNDEKRKLLKVGDVIIFTNLKTKEELNVKVLALHVCKSFKDLYLKFDKTKLGYEITEEANYEDMHKYYSEEDIKNFGVLGIEIKLIWVLSF